ncbi:MAG TPA: hypothetical protein DIT01_09230 [Lentisphaeria bacterium]|nr:hypothetical protein [Lentisphaeria bacterium]
MAPQFDRCRVDRDGGILGERCRYAGAVTAQSQIDLGQQLLLQAETFTLDERGHMFSLCFLPDVVALVLEKASRWQIGNGSGCGHRVVVGHGCPVIADCQETVELCQGGNQPVALAGVTDCCFQGGVGVLKFSVAQQIVDGYQRSIVLQLALQVVGEFDIRLHGCQPFDLAQCQFMVPLLDGLEKIGNDPLVQALVLRCLPVAATAGQQYGCRAAQV